ncbi:hypothetical protein [Ilyobacter polytropus]|uniref:Uncharacterized protein n=1 Tax=Ilyobacter polytropus (strain ATCC 51220 / DSM 2926 / LMG 16218 / CuHBu1) TaxID=572544 RepID=E3HBL3_ILYPC|nr:hypothetical protein [Ilyobacter polytropus]ADO83709.1 hypothetical protein Ilyop_1938 [Ilyobacter polytropus DSM 2926]
MLNRATNTSIDYFEDRYLDEVPKIVEELTEIHERSKNESS